VLKTILVSLITLALTLTANGQAQKNWKDLAEYELYVTAVRGDATPASHLEYLDKWKSQYPQSDYAGTRLKMYLLTYQQMNNHRAAFDTAAEILKTDPNDLQSLREIVDHGLQLVPGQPNSQLSAENKSDLDTIQKSGRYILENLDKIFAANKKPGPVSDEQWRLAKTTMRQSAQTVVTRTLALTQDVPNPR
jgi:hypothetical protein